MVKNKSKSGGGENTNKNSMDQVERKEETIIKVILKLDMHCEDCYTKVKKFVKRFPGVEMVKGGDGGELTKLTVSGKVDPNKLREALEKKVKRNVELISPASPKKDNNTKKEKSICNKGGDNQKSAEKLKVGEDDKKAKGLGISTTVLKMNLHCHCKGHVEKILKFVKETKGCLDTSIDEGKELITVKGEIDTNNLVQSMLKKFKTKVEEIVTFKKEAKKNQNKKPKEKPKEKEKDNNGDGNNKVTYDNQVLHNTENRYYGYVNEYYFPTPQMFSDENPNACSVM